MVEYISAIGELMDSYLDFFDSLQASHLKGVNILGT